MKHINCNNEEPPSSFPIILIRQITWTVKTNSSPIKGGYSILTKKQC